MKLIRLIALLVFFSSFLKNNYLFTYLVTLVEPNFKLFTPNCDNLQCLCFVMLQPFNYLSFMKKSFEFYFITLFLGNNTQDILTHCQGQEEFFERGKKSEKNLTKQIVNGINERVSERETGKSRSEY